MRLQTHTAEDNNTHTHTWCWWHRTDTDLKTIRK